MPRTLCSFSSNPPTPSSLTMVTSLFFYFIIIRDSHSQKSHECPSNFTLSVSAEEIQLLTWHQREVVCKSNGNTSAVLYASFLIPLWALTPSHLSVIIQILKTHVVNNGTKDRKCMHFCPRNQNSTWDHSGHCLYVWSQAVFIASVHEIVAEVMLTHAYK